MAVASDLPDLENRKEYQDARNSVLVDAHGQPLGDPDRQPEPRARPLRRDLAGHAHAIIAIEDRRFYTNAASTCAASAARFVPGRRPAAARRQGGSTITQQFVKNALAAQDDRTVFQKLREAALAYHLTRKWSKEQDPHAST